MRFLNRARKRDPTPVSPAARRFALYLSQRRPCLNIQDIEVITSRLNKTSLICFSPTCEIFDNDDFHKSLKLSRPEKEIFMTILEQDSPNHYFCHNCVKLHPWQPDWSSTVLLHCNNFRGKERKSRSDPNTFFDYSLILPYKHARLVMNRHLYGDAHGFPVERLVPAAMVPSSHGNISCCRRWEARIVENEIMISSIVTLSPINDSKWLEEDIDMGLVSICRHVNTGRLIHRSHIPDQAMPESNKNYVARRHQSVKSCPICTTDYCIDVLWREGHWTVGVTTYHLIGHVQSPRNWCWDSMRYCPQEARASPRFRKLLGIVPGAARSMWSKDGGIDLGPKPDGVWAATPRSHSDRYYLNRRVILD